VRHAMPLGFSELPAARVCFQHVLISWRLDAQCLGHGVCLAVSCHGAVLYLVAVLLCFGVSRTLHLRHRPAGPMAVLQLQLLLVVTGRCVFSTLCPVLSWVVVLGMLVCLNICDLGWQAMPAPLSPTAWEVLCVGLRPRCYCCCGSV
jgi:hypothetical protein